ncbi:MAG TPA: hypothetical protein VNP04_03640 [Alphaproteobacteria bacterium]|nr:hypothetical protein [Alphaproteobacteria bacterium]
MFAHQLRYPTRPKDIALGISQDARCCNILWELEAANDQGLLIVALTSGAGSPLATGAAVEHRLIVQADDPQVVEEVQITIYHLLRELVHVFFEQPGVRDREETLGTSQSHPLRK